MSSASKRLWPLGLLLLAAILAIWLSARRATPPPAAAAPRPSAAPAAGDAPPAPGAQATRDYRAALAQALQLPRPRDRAREFGQVLEAWATRDLEGVLAYVREMRRGTPEYTQALLFVLDALSRRDPDRALRLARELAGTREERAIYSVIFDRLAREDVGAAVQRLALVPGGEGRENALRALSSAWARIDAVAAVAWAQGIREESDRAAALESVLLELAAKEPRQAFDLAQKSLAGPALERTLLLAVQRLAETDAATASGLAVRLPPGESRTLAIVDVARAFAAQDSAAALAWARSLPAGPVETLALHGVLTVLAARDPAAARAYVSGLPAGATQEAAATHLAQQLGHRDPEGTLAWVQTLPSAAARHAALGSAASSWAQRDGAAATQWVAAQPAGSLPDESLNAALSYWLLQDATAARDFVRRLPPATQLGAAEFVAPLLAQREPAATLAWAQTLPDAGARTAALRAAYVRWAGNAPAEARAWLDTASLAPDVKAQLARP